LSKLLLCGYQARQCYSGLEQFGRLLAANTLKQKTLTDILIEVRIALVARLQAVRLLNTTQLSHKQNFLSNK
jgi:hypothetical protein